MLRKCAVMLNELALLSACILALRRSAGFAIADPIPPASPPATILLHMGSGPFLSPERLPIIFLIGMYRPNLMEE